MKLDGTKPEPQLKTVAFILFGILLLREVSWAADPLPGQDYTGVCASCHGPNGISSNPLVPSLAGQDRSYLIGQLQAFREQRRRYAAMDGIIMKLTEEDIAYMASYYAKQPPMAGKERFLFRKRKQGVPFYEGCKGCHGVRAEGREGVPRLAGQQAAYLEKQLFSYQAGERSAAGMTEAVASLTPEQIKALSRFLSNLK